MIKMTKLIVTCTCGRKMESGMNRFFPCECGKSYIVYGIGSHTLLEAIPTEASLEEVRVEKEVKSE